MIRTLAPTGMLGAGFGSDALQRGMSMRPDVIAVDAGSTDPGPYHLGSGVSLYSDGIIKRELRALVAAARGAGVPLVVGSAGGAGTRSQVDRACELVREVARELGLHFRLARIYADIEGERVAEAISRNEVRDFEAGYALTAEAARSCTGLVAQMGDEPIRSALDDGADVVIAGRACDDSAIAAFAIWKGADEALAIHMGKILECGAFSAEPFAMDVMVGTLDETGFVLEPGSLARRASLKSVAAHSLYERENPFEQHGPGRVLDLSQCAFEQLDERRVRVTGTRGHRTDDYWVKLEGARPVGYRCMSVAGIRCPTLIRCIDSVLAHVEDATHARIGDPTLRITVRKYGMNAVMRELEPQTALPHEVGLLLETTAATREAAYDACNALGAKLLHAAYPGQKNTSGNVAFPYSPRVQNLGMQYEFAAYHLMKIHSPHTYFPVALEEV